MTDKTELGSISLARHGKPTVRRRGWSGFGGFNVWWAAYEESGLNPKSKPPQNLKDVAVEAEVLYVSPKPRARETMAAVAGTREAEVMDLFLEAPLPAPPLPLYFPISVWWVLARLYWWIGFHGHFENRKDTDARALSAADHLIEAARRGDVLVCAHGWFNRMIGRELKARGWRLDYNGGDGYWGWRKYLPPE